MRIADDMKNSIFGAIAGAGIILMVMCCSTGDRHEWSPK